MDIINLFLQAVKVVILLLPTIFKVIIFASIFIVIFGPLVKWGLKVIRNIKNENKEER